MMHRGEKGEEVKIQGKISTPFTDVTASGECIRAPKQLFAWSQCRAWSAKVRGDRDTLARGRRTAKGWVHEGS